MPLLPEDVTPAGCSLQERQEDPAKHDLKSADPAEEVPVPVQQRLQLQGLRLQDVFDLILLRLSRD